MCVCKRAGEGSSISISEAAPAKRMGKRNKICMITMILDTCGHILASPITIQSAPLSYPVLLAFTLPAQAPTQLSSSSDRVSSLDRASSTAAFKHFS